MDLLTTQTMVELQNVTISYRQHPALHHLSGAFTTGSLTAVVGPNGAGKSTLLKSILGLLPLSGGKINVAVARQQIAYLPQMAEIDRQFPITVLDCVALGFWNSVGAFRSISAVQRQRLAAALQAVGLSGFEQRTIGTLSSGQLQRVLFARLLVQNAELILLDEPFNAIDSRTTAELLRLVQHWHQQSKTIIAVVHDDAQIHACFPRTLLLARQAVAWGHTAEVLTPENTARARHMHEAWDESAETCHVDLDAATEAVH
jgi:zinc/manganese transport system ATP-binding protein